MDRRTFLKISGALGLGTAAAAVFPASESLAFGNNLYKVTRTKMAMGTFVAITAMHSSRDKADEVIGLAFEEMERVEKLLDRYRSDSPVGQLNKNGYASEMPNELMDVIRRSVHFHEKTGGAFDITVKPLVDLYQEHFSAHNTPPSDAEISRIMDKVDSRALKIENNNVRFLKEGMGITLDGIAKGYIIDRGMEVVKNHKVRHALINAGGDIRAIGGKGGDKSWKIAVQNPDKDGPYLDKISMTDCAMATSGNYEVYFDQEKLFHHIVNPSNGQCPGMSRSATVLSGSVMDADALSTSVFVMEPLAGLRFIEKMPGCEVFILTSTNRKSLSSGWPIT
jgi:thiamine biosynthesis lipoprotein